MQMPPLDHVYVTTNKPERFQTDSTSAASDRLLLGHDPRNRMVTK